MKNKATLPTVRTVPRGNSKTLRNIILTLAYILAFCIRIFSVVKHENVFHEYEPYFNYRATKFLLNYGYEKFLNWFDDRSWYPLGRTVGGTTYPGLMYLTTRLYNLTSVLGSNITLRDICLYISPFMAANTVLMVYLLAYEALKESVKGTKNSPQSNRAELVGVTAAAFFAIVPGFVNRTIAGSYDNEALAMFLFVATCYLWVKALNNGSMYLSILCGVTYFCMSATHGMYIFAANLIPLHVCVMIFAGFYNLRLHACYSIFFIIGTIMSMYVPFIGFQPSLKGEFCFPIATFIMLQSYAIYDIIKRNYIPYNTNNSVKNNYAKRFSDFVQTKIILTVFSFIVVGFVFGPDYTMFRWIKWTKRMYAFANPTYVKRYSKLMASVSEHQPTTWASYFFDLHILMILFPSGLYHCFKRALTGGKIFLITYAVVALYFSASMIRLILILTPIACIVGAISITETLNKAFISLKQVRIVVSSNSNVSAKNDSTISPTKLPSSVKSPTKTAIKIKKNSKSEAVNNLNYQKEIGVLTCIIVACLLVFFTWHSVWVAYEQYSKPSLIMTAKKNDGTPVIFDDFREAFSWLRKNTKEDAKVLGWWDYGYYINALANRTSIVDNNAWSTSHISKVALAMVSSEEHAHTIMEKLDVDYVMVVFGGITGYGSDDMNKIVWMLKIAQDEYPTLVDPKEYYVGRRRYNVGKRGAAKLLNSLLYKLTYFNFGKITTDVGKPTGYDRVRATEIGRKKFNLKYFEEVLTTEHWIVRIYKVKKKGNLDGYK